ncbi:MAG: NTP transferase domain-containing protein [Planctomycetia bacterium]|nr:NTP transferase domain-containing protein [Planctomycetia bacterium]
MFNKKAIVLAAGKGTRMKTELPKVLVPVLNKPMIEYVLDALLEAKIDHITVVVGYQGNAVRQVVENWFDRLDDCELDDDCALFFVEQTQQLGTGHAVMAARELLAGENGPVMILTGDSPMTRSQSLRAMFDEYEKLASDANLSSFAGLLGTAFKENPFGLGRIVRDEQGTFVGIVEEKDASEEQRAIHEVNMSYYLFDIPSLLESLDFLRADNAQKEYYVTDVPAIMMKSGKTVLAKPLLSPLESLGINTPDDLALVEQTMKQLEQQVPNTESK